MQLIDCDIRCKETRQLRQCEQKQHQRSATTPLKHKSCTNYTQTQPYRPRQRRGQPRRFEGRTTTKTRTRTRTHTNTHTQPRARPRMQTHTRTRTHTHAHAHTHTHTHASTHMRLDWPRCTGFTDCTALPCSALHCTALHCTALHCTALHCLRESAQS